MSKYVVIGTAPTREKPVAVGPYQSLSAASTAQVELLALGYDAEAVPLERLHDIEVVDSWED